MRVPKTAPNSGLRKSQYKATIRFDVTVEMMEATNHCAAAHGIEVASLVRIALAQKLYDHTGNDAFLRESVAHARIGSTPVPTPDPVRSCHRRTYPETPNA